MSAEGGRDPDSAEAREDLLIIGCVDKGLNVLGESAKTATFYFIEKNGGLRKSNIPADPDGFTSALRSLFGVGARELLMSIAMELRLAEPAASERLRQFLRAIERGQKSVETGIL